MGGGLAGGAGVGFCVGEGPGAGGVGTGCGIGTLGSVAGGLFWVLVLV